MCEGSSTLQGLLRKEEEKKKRQTCCCIVEPLEGCGKSKPNLIYSKSDGWIKILS